MNRKLYLPILICLIITVGYTQNPIVNPVHFQKSLASDEAKSTSTPTPQSAPASTQKTNTETPAAQGTPQSIDLDAPMEEIVHAIAKAGYVPSSIGLLSHLDDHKMSAASMGNFFWQPTGYVPQNFAVRANVTWSSASPVADWGISGPGFVFHESKNNLFYAVFLNLDGRANLYRLDLSQEKGVNLANKRYGKLDVPTGSAQIMLLVQGKAILFFVNDTLVLNEKEERLLRQPESNGRLNFALASGTNKDTGIQIEMTNVDLWQFGDTHVLSTTPAASLSERQQQDLQTEKGIQAFLLGEYQSAIESLDLAIKENPAYANPAGFLYRGRAYYGLGQYGQAVSDITESLSIDPENEKAYIYRGYAYDKQKKSSQALTDFTKAIALDPEDVWGYRSRASNYAAGKKFELALKDFDKAIELEEDYAPTRNNRCWTYYLMKQYEKALPDCEAAVKIAPDDINYLESRASVYAALKNNKQAVLDLDKILTLTDDPTVQQRVKQALKKVSP